MVKIKREVEMTLPQLIEWGWDNSVRDKEFCNDCGGRVHFRLSGLCEVAYVGEHETFTVEVEEEITEEKSIKRNIHVKQ